MGLGNPGKPRIDFVDNTGNRFCTDSVEWILRNLDLFPGPRDQCRLLAGAALEYGLGAHALMGADLDNMSDVWDVRDGAGRVLLAGVTHNAAYEASENYQRQPDCVAPISIRLVRNRIEDDPRHEGPLVLLHHNLGITTFTGIAVKSHAGRCGMMLEEALWRFDQFSAADQAQLLAGLAKHFDLGQAQREMAGAA